MTSYIGRSVTTGKYHWCLAERVTDCNHSGQVRSSRNRPATEEEITKADSSSFCKKCFPRGKPE